MTKSRALTWLFQCNPKRFDLAPHLKSGVTEDNWSMNQHRDKVSPGDRVFFWQSGGQACLLAEGRVTSPVYEREDTTFGRNCVDIVFEYKVVPPLTREEVNGNEVLRRFSPFGGVQGTNFIIDDAAILTELEKAIASRRVSISAKPLGAQFVQTQKTLDDAIKDANAEVARKLREHLANMDPTAFEWLARRLFDKLGYQEVTVTKRSGDGGIDVKATLVDGGVAKIPVRIQVKRQNNPVGRPVVQSLRGALRQGEIGVLLISSSFGEDARIESQDRTTTPITLIDGRTLVDLLIKHQIGARRLPVTLCGLELNDLTMERLQSAVEEIEESGQVEP